MNCKQIPAQLRDGKFGFVKLRTKEKIPFEKGWQNKPYDYTEIEKWLLLGNNYGVLCGYNGLIVVDADTEELNNYCLKKFPKTFTVKSSKGFHFYFICTDVTKKLVLQKNGTHYGEIQAKGTQIVAPLSIHPGGIVYTVTNDEAITIITKNWLFAILKDFMDDSANELKTSNVIPVKNSFISNNAVTTTSYPSSDADVVAEKCAFIKCFKKTGFANNEPAWHDALGVIWHCTNGSTRCHEFSAADPNYNQQETDKKLDNFKKNDVNPILCTTIAQHGFCANCTHKNIKSPIKLGYAKTTKNNKQNFDYKVTGKGIYYLQTDKDANPLSDLWLCSHIDIEARTRNADGLNHGKLLVFKDADNRIHQWAIPMELLAGDGTDYRRNLLSMGVQISSNKKAREKLTEYLLIIVPQKTVLCADKLGWYGNVFVFPEEVIGSKNINEDVLFQSSTINIGGFKTKGTLEDWKNNIAKYCVGNSRLVLAVSTAFAAPLLNFTHDESGGVHFKGSSSGGKTTTLKIACTVWGEPSRLEQWRATSNGLEGIATKYNDSLLCLDELSQIDPREAGEAAYMLANGSGKNRSKKDGSLRQKTDWRILFCSSGEIGLAEHMRQLGKEAKAGQQVRILEIPADAGCDLGIFENIHGFVSGAEFAQHLNRQVDLYYGTPIREFLKSITAGDADLLVKNIERLKDDFIRDLSIENTDGQVKRAASRFALIAAAGELATSIGITGWTNDEAINAAKLCFHNWLLERGGDGQYEEKQITSQIMEFFQRNSQSRFAIWRSGFDTQNHFLSEVAMSATVCNKAGFVKIEENTKTFFVETEVFRNELCRGYSSKQVARICIKIGWLISDKGGKASTLHRMPDTGKTRRMYQFTDKVLGGDDDV